MADGTWDFYFTHDGQAPLLVALDLAHGALAPLPELPERLIVSATMRTPMPGGLRAASEGPALFALEARLREVLTVAGWIPVGRVVTRGRTDFIYHGPVGELPVVADAEYTLVAVSHTDASWDLYRNFLWPGAREWQQMQNRRGLLELRDRGDDGKVARRIDHTLQALDEEAVVEGARAVAAAGFVPGGIEEGEQGWVVRCSRTDAPARIDGVTAEILEAIDGMEDVAYLGWTCGMGG